MMVHRSLVQNVLRIQALYYMITGAWPQLSMSTFERVTGPKTDDWLVRMVGLLALTIGVSLWAGSRDAQPARATLLLAVLSAASFAAIGSFFGLTGRISPVYLADAAVELALIVLLLLGHRRARRAAGA